MGEMGQLKQALICSSAGAISGAISRTVTSPLDVIKIRFQVQMEPTSSWALLEGTCMVLQNTLGFCKPAKSFFERKGFWRGNVPALMLYMPYAAIQFTVLQYLKTLAAGSSKQEDHLRLNPYLSYFSGAFAGCAATIGSYPFDLLRTVLASQGEPKAYPTMRSALFDIIKTRGVRGLYAGLSPTLVEIIPYAGLQFGSYDTFKRWMMAWNRYRFSNIGPIKPDDSLSSFQLILCGFAAGTCAKGICHPLDVVKKRFQIEGLERHPRYGARVESQKYKNMHHALREIFHAEGWPGLFKGIFPSLLKSAPAAAVTFVAYEHTSNWLQSLLN